MSADSTGRHPSTDQATQRLVAGADGESADGESADGESADGQSPGTPQAAAAHNPAAADTPLAADAYATQYLPDSGSLPPGLRTAEGRPRAGQLAEGRLAEAGPDALREILRREIDDRRRRGETPTADDYRTRFAAHLAVIEDLFATAADHDPHATSAHASYERSSAGYGQAGYQRAAYGPAGYGQSAAPDRGNSRYRIIRPHAKGGLGEVFVARDEEIDRDVALKEIQLRYGDDADSRARFLKEAEITGKLEHPGIVPVYGLGTYPDGRPYYAMRFIQGDSLAEALRRFHDPERKWKDDAQRKLEFRGLLQRFIDVCNAIDYAHSKGVLHRDLKPGNVMLGQYGETLVVDWGLAKRMEDKTPERVETVGTVKPPPEDSGLTQYGQVLGTPAFMSPEQAAGKLDEMGPATDVYGLGATLYTLLTGEPPFTAGDLESLMQTVRKGLPVERYPRKLNRRIPAALESICVAAMQVKPADRYPTAKRLAADVENWLAEAKVSVHRESKLERYTRFTRRHKAAVRAAMATLVAVVAMGAWMVVDQSQQRLRQSRLDDVQGAKVGFGQTLAALRADRADEDLLALVYDLNQAAAAGAAELEPTIRRAIAWQQTHCHRVESIRLLPADVTHGTLSPWGRRFAYVAGKRIHVLETDGLAPVVEPIPMVDEVRLLGFSADGTLLAVQTDQETHFAQVGERVAQARAEVSQGPRLVSPGGVPAAEGLPGAASGLPAAAGLPGAVGGGSRFGRGVSAAHGRPVAVEAGEEVNSVLLDDAGRYLVRTARQRETGATSCRVYETETGRLLGELRHGSSAGAAAAPRCAAFDPEGRWIVTAGDDDSLRLWDLPSLAARGETLSTYDRVTALAVGADEVGNTLIAALGRQAVVWRLHPREVLSSFTPEGAAGGTASDAASGLQIGNGGRSLLVGNALFDTDDGVRNGPPLDARYDQLRLKADGTLVAYQADSTIDPSPHLLARWRPADANRRSAVWKKLIDERYRAGEYRQVFVSTRDTRRLVRRVYESGGGKLRECAVIDRTTGRTIVERLYASAEGDEPFAGDFDVLAVSADGAVVAAADNEARPIDGGNASKRCLLHRWSAATGRPQPAAHGEDDPGASCRWIEIDPRGEAACVGVEDGSAAIWDLATGRIKAERLPMQGLLGARFLEPGRLLGFTLRGLTLFRFPEGHVASDTYVLPFDVRDVAVEPTAKRIAVLTERRLHHLDFALRLTDEPVRNVNAVSALFLDADLLVIGLADGGLRLWDVPGGCFIHTTGVPTRTPGVWGVAADGRLCLADDDPNRPLRQESVGGRTMRVNSDGRRLEIALPSAADSPVDEIRRWAEAAVNKKIGADGLTTPLSLAEWEERRGAAAVVVK